MLSSSTRAKPGGPPAGRAVAAPVGVLRRQQRDRRAGDEVAAVAIEVVELLVEHGPARLADVLAKLVEGRDRVSSISKAEVRRRPRRTGETAG
jgi:hypothetical protein